MVSCFNYRYKLYSISTCSTVDLSTVRVRYFREVESVVGFKLWERDFTLAHLRFHPLQVVHGARNVEMKKGKSIITLAGAHIRGDRDFSNYSRYWGKDNQPFAIASPSIVSSITWFERRSDQFLPFARYWESYKNWKRLCYWGCFNWFFSIHRRWMWCHVSFPRGL